MSLKSIKEKLQSNKKKSIAIGLLALIGIAFPVAQPVVNGIAQILGLTETTNVQ